VEKKKAITQIQYCKRFLNVIFNDNIYRFDLVWLKVFNTTFNNISFISWRSVLLVEDTEVTGENNGPVAIH
jgi:hypothetical protein